MTVFLPSVRRARAANSSALRRRPANNTRRAVRWYRFVRYYYNDTTPSAAILRLPLGVHDATARGSSGGKTILSEGGGRDNRYKGCGGLRGLTEVTVVVTEPVQQGSRGRAAGLHTSGRVT